ncbi:MAG: hypothetical protein U9O56_06115, partial [Campylobacterota bacterium]|nr:hypothetical protein [Campylobacterota bacterium]
LHLNKGKNSFINNYGSIDIEKSFGTKDIQKVEVFDTVSKKYATYPYRKNNLKLKSIEKGIKFYIYSTKKVDIQLYIKTPSKICQDFMRDKNYDYIEDSGIDRGLSINSKDSIAIGSRYYSNQLKNSYTDTKVILIYPKQNKVSKMKYKYGPGIPKVMINYSKEYENKKFYIYDFFSQGCYMGYFPSVKIPPFRELRRVN